jgi:hypothetical protein
MQNWFDSEKISGTISHTAEKSIRAGWAENDVVYLLPGGVVTLVRGTGGPIISLL